METENKSLINLVNPEFDINYEGNIYRIRKATMDKAIAWQQRLKELDADPDKNQKIVAFCIYIMLKDKIPELSEEKVLNTIPADIDSMDLMVQLGFLNPSSLEIAKAAKSKFLKQLTTEPSSQT